MPYAYVNKITFLSYPFKFTPRYLRATDRRIENRRRRRHNFFRNLFLEVWRRMRNVRLAGMTTVTKWNYADIENHDGRLRLHLTVSRKPWGFLSLKGVKIPKLNWRNNEPRCRAFDSGAKTFKRNYVLLFNLYHLLFSFLSDLNGFELATKSRENDEWDDFVPRRRSYGVQRSRQCSRRNSFCQLNRAWIAMPRAENGASVPRRYGGDLKTIEEQIVTGQKENGARQIAREYSRIFFSYE